MRLRYKMWIVLFTVAIMLIGLGTFSTLSPSFVKNTKEKIVENKVIASIDDLEQGKNSDKTVNEKITEMVKKYFTAKQKVDMNSLKKYVSDIKQVEEKKLGAEAEYIEEYRNIQCTVINALEKGTYRVYVYYEAKLYDIDTLIPSLSALYVKETSKGVYQVYMGTIDSKSEEYIEKLDKRKDILQLQQSVQKKVNTAISTDSKVKDFYEMINSASEDDQEEDNTDIDKEGQGKPKK